MISPDIPTLIASLGGIVSGFYWRTKTKRAIQAIMATIIVAIPLLIAIQYSAITSVDSIEGVLPVIGGLVLQFIGLFFYTWGTFNAGKWFGKIYLKVKDKGYISEEE